MTKYSFFFLAHAEPPEMLLEIQKEMIRDWYRGNIIYALIAEDM